MPERTEIEALKASFRGAMATAASLAELRERVEALQATGDVEEGTLRDLARVASAHAVASAALRGFVERMTSRRERERGTPGGG